MSEIPAEAFAEGCPESIERELRQRLYFTTADVQLMTRLLRDGVITAGWDKETNELAFRMDREQALTWLQNR